ncbi:TPA: hypothetical protein ACGAPA_000730 [Legionella pneumophila]|nr:hypothetical protein [Legionella pneumophila]HAU1484864.1 hypothetical protein [Legionella pneumophila]HAU1497697.1 hypothetical protein [Legionella pneumophila]HAU1516734.1 hypothetical protein [Legionella pneumophila]HCJ1111487.1 hypothetical protein [Legionella pneumophila]
MIDIKLRKKALEQLARTSGQLASIAIEKEVLKIEQVLISETEYDMLSNYIDLLDVIAFRVYEKAISIFVILLERLKDIQLSYQQIPNYPLEQLKKLYTRNKLVIQVLDALNHIRYHEPEKILDIIFEYSIHEDEDVKQKAIRGIEAFAQYNLDVFYGDGKGWKGLGWLPQEEILKKIKSIYYLDRKKYIASIFTAIRQILSPSIEGASSTYNTVTLKTIPVPAKEDLMKLRQEALEILKLQYIELNTIEEKKQLLTVMQTATQFSRSGERTSEVNHMIISSTLFILQFMSELVETEDLQILQTIEHDVYWIYYHMSGLSPDIEKNALEVNEKLKANQEFQIFRVLIGYESIFHDWKEEKDKDFYKQEQKIREDNILELAQTINKKNYTEWKQRIFAYAAIRSNDMATFPFFGKFLENFGKQSSDLAFQLLSESSSEFEPFILPILRGIEQSKKKKRLLSFINSWIEKDCFLLAITRFLEFSADFNQSILTQLFNKAKLSKDTSLLSQIITTSAAKYKAGDNKLIKEILLSTIQLCTEQKYAHWIFNLWFSKEYVGVFGAMEDNDYEIVLDNLMWLNKIDYEAEEVLLPIAQKSPLMVIRFFCNRIHQRIEQTRDDFESLPYQFSSLSEPLSKIPEHAIQLVLSYNQLSDELFTYNAARLLNLIFRKLEEHVDFEKALMALVQTSDEKTLFFIVDILRGYHGNISTHSLCKALIKRASNNEGLLNSVSVALCPSGITFGEDGILIAYQERLKDIELWLNDSNPEVVLFAENFKKSLERQIEAEKLRVAENIALRKHQYGSNNE